VHCTSIRLTVSPCAPEWFVLKLEQEKRETMKQTPYYVVESSTNFPFPKQESEKTSPSTSKVVSASVHSGSYDQAHNILGLANRRRRQLNLLPLNEHCHSPGEQCPICDKSGVLTMQNAESFARMSFQNAAPIFLSFKENSISKRTREMYVYHLRELNVFFGPMTLQSIHIGHIQAYQEKRKAEVGPSLVNHELNVLKQMLTKAGTWKEIKEWYHPLRVGKGKRPKVMTREEEDKFFKIVATNPDWRVAYLAASITNNTSASGTELRHLQLKDINLRAELPVIYVPDENVKNEFRAGRPIPLNPTAYKQVSRVVERAMELGASKPEHYIFPFRVKRNHYDVTRPASRSFIRTAFRKMREATGITWLTPHCLRFQCVTKMVEAGMDEDSIVQVAGWKNRKMLSWYNRPRLSHIAEAMNRIDPAGRRPTQPANASWLPKQREA
jgi:integrase